MRERLVEVLADQPAHLQRFQIIGILIAAGKGVGAEHDAALDLGAETLAARPASTMSIRSVVAGRAMAEVNAVVAGQVAGCLGRGDQIIRGDGVGAVRQRYFRDLRAHPLVDLQRLAHALFHFGIEALVEILAGHADGQRLDRLLDRRRVGGTGSIDAGAVAAVVAGDRFQQQGGVGDVVGEGPI